MAPARLPAGVCVSSRPQQDRLPGPSKEARSLEVKRVNLLPFRRTSETAYFSKPGKHRDGRCNFGFRPTSDVWNVLFRAARLATFALRQRSSAIGVFLEAFQDLPQVTCRGCSCVLANECPWQSYVPSLLSIATLHSPLFDYRRKSDAGIANSLHGLAGHDPR
jgi:hypothetical protein